MPMSEVTARALLFAIERHHGQLRKKSDAPYVVHPVRVARLATAAGLELGLDRARLERIEAAALLHDTVEDTSATIEDVEREFGAEVAAIVAELTQDASLPKPERRRKMIDKAGGMSFDARLIKLADRFDNLRDLAMFDDAFRARYTAEAEALVAAMRGTAPTLEQGILAACERWRVGAPRTSGAAAPPAEAATDGAAAGGHAAGSRAVGGTRVGGAAADDAAAGDARLDGAAAGDAAARRAAAAEGPDHPRAGSVGA